MPVAPAVCRTTRDGIGIGQFQQMNLLRPNGDPGAGLTEIGALRVLRQTKNIAVKQQ